MGGRPLHGRLHLVANRDQQRALAPEPAVSLVARRELRPASLPRPDDRRGAPADPARAQGGGSHRRAADPDRDGPADTRRAGVLGPGVCRSQPGRADAGARAGAGPGVEQRAAGARRHPRPDRRRRSADPGRQLPADRRIGAAGVDRGGEPVEDADAVGTRRRHLEPGAGARRSGPLRGAVAGAVRRGAARAVAPPGTDRARDRAGAERHRSPLLQGPREAADQPGRRVYHVRPGGTGTDHRLAIRSATRPTPRSSLA